MGPPAHRLAALARGQSLCRIQVHKVLFFLCSDKPCYILPNVPLPLESKGLNYEFIYPYQQIDRGFQRQQKGEMTGYYPGPWIQKWCHIFWMNSCLFFEKKPRYDIRKGVGPNSLDVNCWLMQKYSVDQLISSGFSKDLNKVHTPDKNI